jgi:hypothetical protein
MNRRISQRSPILFSLLALCLVLGWMGCVSTLKGGSEDPSKVQDIGVGKYYFFDDVLIPKELNYHPDESFVYETPQFKAGSMVFSKWWLDSANVADFFAYYMEKDNWKMLNSFRGKESVLNFSKPDKTCTIKIREKWNGTTLVEIQVGPLGMKKM